MPRYIFNLVFIVWYDFWTQLLFLRLFNHNADNNRLVADPTNIIGVPFAIKLSHYFYRVIIMTKNWDVDLHGECSIFYTP